MKKKLLIDAISTSSGGAISHLYFLLDNFDQQKYFEYVEVHVPFETMCKLPRNNKIKYVFYKKLEKFLIFRIFWQVVILNLTLIFKKFDAIFITGGSHFIFYKNNVVTISQNLLPFVDKEVKKYFFELFYFKLILLKITQSISFKFSKGIIFLHKYSKKIILNQIGKVNKKTKIIPHCINLNLKIIKNTINKKIRIIYVSNIDYYKNHAFIISAMNELYAEQPELKKKIFFEFYGNEYRPARINLDFLLEKSKDIQKNFKFCGHVDKKKIYKNKKGYSTISLFSSSCENFSVSLLEAFYIGLPILCVSLQPMRSVIQNYAHFYKHNSKKDFKKQLLNLIDNLKSIRNNKKNKKKFLINYHPKLIALKTYKFLHQMV